MDARIMSWLVEHRSPTLTSAARALMWLGATRDGLVCAALVVVVVCLVRRRPLMVLTVGAAAVIATVTALLLKSEFHRARPGAAYAIVPADGYSMPSTAAAMSAAVLLPLVALTPRGRVRQAALALVAVAHAGVMLAVMYLGAHWFTDTVAGTALGGAVGAVFLAVSCRREGATKAGRGVLRPREERLRRARIDHDGGPGGRRYAIVPRSHPMELERRVVAQTVPGHEVHGLVITQVEGQRLTR